MVSPPSEDPTVACQRQEAWLCVAWGGEVDVAVAPAMLARTLQGAHDGSRVVADLGSVQFMDAAGLGALVKARSVLRARGGDLLVRNPPPRVRWMLARFELTDLIEPATGNGSSGSTAQPGGWDNPAAGEPATAQALRARPSPVYLPDDGPVDSLANRSGPDLPDGRDLPPAARDPRRTPEEAPGR